MQKIRRSFLVCLVLAGLIALIGRPQPGRGPIQNPCSCLGRLPWGVYNGDREASRLGREEIVARENYCSTSGCVLRLDGVEVRPGPVPRRPDRGPGHHLHHPDPGCGGHPGVHQTGYPVPGPFPGPNQEHREPASSTAPGSRKWISPCRPPPNRGLTP